MELLPDSKKFKILQLSNAVFVPSGYGVESKGMLYEWNKYYDVRQLAFYGLEGAKLELNGLQIYPALTGDVHGNRTASLIFRGSLWKPDLFITLYDIWMGAYVEAAETRTGIKPIHPHWIPIVMVDHDPIPELTLMQARSAYRVVTPTMFGVNQFFKNGMDVKYIPFGTNTKVYKPPEDKADLKNWVNTHAVPFDMKTQTRIDENSFLIMMSGANKDPYRKAFMRMFHATRIFLENNPDAVRDTRIYVHSWMKMARDIPHGAKMLKIHPICKATSDLHNLCSIPEAVMAKLYGAADVLMHLSEGGGFEIPILESLACGVPVIGSDFVGMNELVKGHGWSIPMKATYYSALDAKQGLADEYKAAEALEDAYNHAGKREKFGRAGRKFALDYDFSKINVQWIEFFEEIRREWRHTPVQERMI